MDRMNPLLAAALGSIIRWALTFAAGFFVEHGIWTSTEATTYVAGAVMAVLTLMWMLWVRYRDRLKFLTALTMSPGATENEVKAHIASGGATPSISTPKDTIPVMQEKK